MSGPRFAALLGADVRAGGDRIERAVAVGQSRAATRFTGAVAFARQGRLGAAASLLLRNRPADLKASPTPERDARELRAFDAALYELMDGDATSLLD